MTNRKNIKAKLTIPIIGMAMLLLFAPVCPGQTSVSIGDEFTCLQEEVLLPVQVNDFMDVSAFTFYIQLNTEAVDFIDIVNVHEDLTFSTIPESNLDPVSEWLTIAWFGMMPVNFEDEKLFDIHLRLKQTDASLEFKNESEIALSDLSVLENVQYDHGSVLSFSSLPVTPAANNIVEGETAQFFLPMQNTGIELQWQENSGDVWINLSNNNIYSGVNASVLKIFSVPLDFDSRKYRCKLSNAFCSGTSQEASLEVSVGINESGGKEESKLMIYPNPVYDKLHYRISGIRDVFGLNLQLTNETGVVLIDKKIPHLIKGDMQYVNLSDKAAGFYILKISSENRIVGTAKVLKR